MSQHVDPTSRASGDPEQAERRWDLVFSEELRPSAVIGHYRIIRLIGRGGMGVVFEAEQENPRRRVALKVINPGLAAEQLLSRFRLEAQILGRLQHPGIAQIFEADAFDLGAGPQPFFAMEYVEGRSLTAFAREENLDARRRLELMIRICEAVQHAHQKGVIHRDLKPGNILVTADGQPKILDFGVARATDGDIQNTTLRTEIGKLVGTIPYMSPEQAAGKSDELDTQSDVYALGVVCYELLAGRLPYDLDKRLIHEAVRVIQEKDPAPLSSVDRDYRGDVETIVAKALEKEKARRYQSASDFASDIRRYLNHEPITARPPSTRYQVRKFARRNRVLVGGIAAVFVALVLGLVGTLYGLKQAIEARNSEATQKQVAKASEQKALNEAARADHEADRAIAQLNKAERIAAFMEDVLNGAGPSVAMGRDTEMLREMLDAAAARISAGELNDSPEAELRLRLSIGGTYRDLAVYDDATQMLDAATSLAESLAPVSGESVDVARALNRRSELLSSLGRVAEAEVLSQRALEMMRQFHPGDHVDVAACLGTLAGARQDLARAAEAEPLFHEALEMSERLFPGNHPSVASYLHLFAGVQLALGRSQTAEPLLERALDMRRRLYKRDHPDVATSLETLGYLRLDLGRAAEAEPLFLEALEMRQRLVKGDHPTVAESLCLLARARRDLRRAAEAEPLLVKALEMYQRIFKGDHPDVALILNDLARVQQDLGRFADAEASFRQAMTMNQRLWSGDHPNVATTMNDLAMNLYAEGQVTEAVGLFEQALAMFQRMYKGDHSYVATTLDNLRAARQALGRASEAEPLIRQALEMRQRLYKGDHPRVAHSLNNLGRIDQDLGLAGEAEPLLQQSLEMYQRLYHGDQKDIARGLHNLSRVRLDLGRGAEAEQLCTQGLEMRRRLFNRDHPDLAGSLRDLAIIDVALDRPADAEPFARECLAMLERLFPDGDAREWMKYDAMSLLGEVIARQRRFEEAEPLLLTGWTGLSQDSRLPAPTLMPGSDFKGDAIDRIVRLYDAWNAADPGRGHDAKAAEWCARLEALGTDPATVPRQP